MGRSSDDMIAILGPGKVCCAAPDDPERTGSAHNRLSGQSRGASSAGNSRSARGERDQRERPNGRRCVLHRLWLHDRVSVSGSRNQQIACFPILIGAADMQTPFRYASALSKILGCWRLVASATAWHRVLRMFCGHPGPTGAGPANRADSRLTGPRDAAWAATGAQDSGDRVYGSCSAIPAWLIWPVERLSGMFRPTGRVAPAWLPVEQGSRRH